MAVEEKKIITVNKGTTSQWNNAVRTLESGEFGYDTESKKLVIGNGESSFDELTNISSSEINITYTHVPDGGFTEEVQPDWEDRVSVVTPYYLKSVYGNNGPGVTSG